MTSLLHWFEHYFVVIGTVIFTAIIVATYWPGRKKAIERNADIPLRERD